MKNVTLFKTLIVLTIHLFCINAMLCDSAHFNPSEYNSIDEVCISAESTSNCICPELIDPDAICTQEFNPVCDCDNVQYSNECMALSSGVKSYRRGPCGSPTSGWITRVCESDGGGGGSLCDQIFDIKVCSDLLSGICVPGPYDIGETIFGVVNIDVAEITNVKFIWRKPSGETIEQSSGWISNGSRAVTKTIQADEPGTWRLFIEISDASNNTESCGSRSFQVIQPNTPVDICDLEWLHPFLIDLLDNCSSLFDAAYSFTVHVYQYNGETQIVVKENITSIFGTSYIYSIFTIDGTLTYHCDENCHDDIDEINASPIIFDCNSSLPDCIEPTRDCVVDPYLFECHQLYDQLIENIDCNECDDIEIGVARYLASDYFYVKNSCLPQSVSIYNCRLERVEYCEGNDLQSCTNGRFYSSYGFWNFNNVWTCNGPQSSCQSDARDYQCSDWINARVDLNQNSCSFFGNYYRLDEVSIGSNEYILERKENSIGTTLVLLNVDGIIVAGCNYEHGGVCSDPTIQSISGRSPIYVCGDEREICNDDCICPDLIDPDLVCTQIYDPVCGCDGVTYSNDCFAQAAGVKSWTKGECGMTSGPVQPGLCDDGNPSTTNDRIDEDCNCIGEDQSDCICPELIDPDLICTLEYDPVCGCNEMTYSNACFAQAAGVKSWTKGECGMTSGPVQPGLCDDGNPSTTNDRIDEDCNCIGEDQSNCICPDLINPDLICNDIVDPVCGCDGTTYTNECEARKAGVREFQQGECGMTTSPVTPMSCDDGNPATLNDVITEDCGCEGELSDCICPDLIDPNLVCDGPYEPVCGCDQVTYYNECRAQRAGVKNFQQGECGQTVSLPISTSCDDNNLATDNDRITDDCVCIGSTTISPEDFICNEFIRNQWILDSKKEIFVGQYYVGFLDTDMVILYSYSFGNSEIKEMYSMAGDFVTSCISPCNNSIINEIQSLLLIGSSTDPLSPCEENLQSYFQSFMTFIDSEPVPGFTMDFGEDESKEIVTVVDISTPLDLQSMSVTWIDESTGISIGTYEHEMDNHIEAQSISLPVSVVCTDRLMQKVVFESFWGETKEVMTKLYDVSHPCSVTSISEVLREVRAVPNPTTNFLNVSIGSDKPKSLQLFNCQGVMVGNSKTSTIDLSNLSSGVYILVIDGVYQEKIIKI